MSAKKAILGLMLGWAVVGFTSAAEAGERTFVLEAGQRTWDVLSYPRGTAYIMPRAGAVRYTVSDSTGFIVADSVGPGPGPLGSITWEVRAPGKYRIVVENRTGARKAIYIGTNGN